MNNSINKLEIENSIKKIELLSENVRVSLNKSNSIILDNVNTNKGVWDGIQASEFRNKWELLSEDIPTFINDFEVQIENLKVLLNSINNLEEK